MKKTISILAACSLLCSCVTYTNGTGSSMVVNDPPVIGVPAVSTWTVPPDYYGPNYFAGGVWRQATTWGVNGWGGNNWGWGGNNWGWGGGGGGNSFNFAWNNGNNNGGNNWGRRGGGCNNWNRGSWGGGNRGSGGGGNHGGGHHNH